MSRKKQLSNRADRYGKRGFPPLVHGYWSIASVGFEDGYHAAMKDLRKIVRDARRCAMVAGVQDPFKRSQLRDLGQRIVVDKWLRPLR